MAASNIFNCLGYWAAAHTTSEARNVGSTTVARKSPLKSERAAQTIGSTRRATRAAEETTTEDGCAPSHARNSSPFLISTKGPSRFQAEQRLAWTLLRDLARLCEFTPLILRSTRRARLEGWVKARGSSFETQASLAPQDEGLVALTRAHAAPTPSPANARTCAAKIPARRDWRCAVPKSRGRPAYPQK